MSKLLSRVQLLIGAGDGTVVADGADTFDPVGRMTQATGPSASKPEVDATDLDSQVVERVGGIPDSGTFTATVNIDTIEATGALIAGHARCEADAATPGQQRNFRLHILHPATQIVLRRLSWKGEVMSWAPTYSSGAVQQASIEVRVNTRPVLTLRP